MATNNDVNIKIQVDASQAQQSTVNYKAKIKELKEQMAALLVETNGLATATEEQRAQYNALAKEAGALTDALGDVSAQVRANADDYQYFNAALEGLKGGAAVAQGLVGTLDLLGMSNTGVENVVKTLMSLQGVMNSINAVQQVFNKDSKVRIALQKLLATEVKNTAVAEGQATVAAGALAAGEGVATTASFTLAGACKAVGVAIKSIPVIGWILAAISALTTLIALIAKANTEADNGRAVKEKILELDRQRESALEKIRDKHQLATEEIERQIKLLKESEKGTTAYETAASKLAQEWGVSAAYIKENADNLKELQDASDGYNTALEEINVNQESINNAKEKQKELDEWVVKLSMASKSEAKEMLKTAVEDKRIREESVVYLKQYNEWRRKGDWDAETAQKAIKNELKAQYDEYDGVISQAQKAKKEAENNRDENEKNLNTIKDTSKAWEKAGDAAEKAREKWKKWNEERKNVQKEYVSSVEDMAIADAEYDEDWNRWADERVKKADRLYNDDIKKYEEQLKKKLITQEQYDELSKSLEEKHQNEVEKIRLDAAKKISDEQERIDQDRLKKQEEAEKQALDAKEKARKAVDRQNKVDAEILQARLNNLKEGSEEYYALQDKIEDERFEQEMENLRRRLADEEITIEEFDQLRLESWKTHQQNLTAIQDEEDEKRTEMTRQRLQTVGSIFSNMSDFVTTLMNMELEEAEGNEKKQKEIKKKYATAQAVMKIGQIGIDTALGIMGVWSQVMQLGPIAGPILGAVLSATIGALGIANTAKAIQEKNKIMKAARGAYVVGASHTAGGVNMELEGGEMVLNKNVAKIPQFRAIASAMNVATGGVSLGGGSLENGAKIGITKEDVQNIVQETVAGIAAIPVVVSAQTITETQRRVSLTTQRSQI